MSTLRFPWQTPPAPEPARGQDTKASRRRGRRPAISVLTDPKGWAPGALTVSGASDAVTAFIAAAEGPGITPWQEDDALLEEDAFHRALAVPLARRGLSVEACRQLARQYREAVAGHRARAAAWGQSAASRQACPLDLHRLLPVPTAVLAHGAADPAALAWCRVQWGVTQIRRVERLSIPQGATYRFWALGGAELRLERLARLWPALDFRRAADKLDPFGGGFESRLDESLSQFSPTRSDPAP
jgi:hypothetical protein